jgi:DNA-binding NarL/FixJ family response regulator
VPIREFVSVYRSGVTCVLADDHPAVVEAVSQLLLEHGIDVIGLASDGEAALSLIADRKPTVAILDLAMPRIGGIEVARRSHLAVPETASVLYTGFGERELLVEALDAGARGFVLKEGPTDELIHAVKLVAQGDVYVDPALAASLIRAGAAADLRALSRREREILRHLADGSRNDQIAETLGLAPATVRTYIMRAMKKLEAETRTEAVATALRQSLIA